MSLEVGNFLEEASSARFPAWWCAPPAIGGRPAGSPLFPHPQFVGTHTRTDELWPGRVEDTQTALQSILTDLLKSPSRDCEIIPACGPHALQTGQGSRMGGYHIMRGPRSVSFELG